MASHGYPPGFLFHSELVSSGVSKHCQPVWHCSLPKHDMIRFNSLYERPLKREESWKPIFGLPEARKFVKIDSTFGNPAIIDMQDAQPNSILFSLGISEQCTRHEKILQLLKSGLDVVGGKDLSKLAKTTWLQGLTKNVHQKPFAPDCESISLGVEAPPTLFYPHSELYSHTPILKLAGDLAYESEIMFPEDQGLFSGVIPELKDILAVVAGYYLSKNATMLRKQSVIPHFNRLDWKKARANIHESTSTLESVKFTPMKSPQKLKLKPSKKKKADRKAGERSFHRENSFHACESLLSIMVNKRQNGRTIILSLKKSGPELPRLLTQLSASVAGTGLAVLFSIIRKVAYGGIHLSRSKLLNTGIGFALFCLSGSLNRLRDTVVGISKSSGKQGLREEEMMRMLDKCVNEVFYRALTLMVVTMLRFA